MAEYIKREDAIIEAINAVYAHEIGYLTPIEEMIEKYINDIPAADVRENVRGEWRTLYAKRTVPVRADGYVCRPVECSICGQYLIDSGDYSVYGHFCPCCGAKMRGENE